jgi:hypothetical protein
MDIPKDVWNITKKRVYQFIKKYFQLDKCKYFFSYYNYYSYSYSYYSYYSYFCSFTIPQLLRFRFHLDE